MTDEELIPLAAAFYGEIKSRVSGPKDAAGLLLMIHVMLWLNYKDDSTSTEDMLASYCSDFQTNFDLNWKANLNA